MSGNDKRRPSARRPGKPTLRSDPPPAAAPEAAPPAATGKTRRAPSAKARPKSQERSPSSARLPDERPAVPPPSAVARPASRRKTAVPRVVDAPAAASESSSVIEPITESTPPPPVDSFEPEQIHTDHDELGGPPRIGRDARIENVLRMRQTIERASNGGAGLGSYHLRYWSDLSRVDDVDEFGFDPKYDAQVAPALEVLYRRWFRVHVTGLEHVPMSGRALIVANHGGPLPLDGPMLKTAIRLERGARSDFRWLAEDAFFYMPFVGAALNRLGAVRACQENAERLLRSERLVAVFPEGVKGISKLYRHRYQLQRFGRGGFVKLALRTGTPIVPAALIGGEEASPVLANLPSIAKLLDLPVLPITPTFPLLGPLGLLPLPSQWHIVFGEPIDLSAHGPGAEHDPVVVARLSDRVRQSVQVLVDRALATRRSVFFD